MQFEFDPEALIGEVRKRPGLWDFDTLEHRSKQYKQEAWEDIVKTLSGSNDMTRTEMRELELQLQKKWKSYRDCYIKQLKNSSKQRRPYIYAKLLSFLKPTVRTSKVEEEDSAASDNGEPSSKGRKRKIVVMKKNKHNKKDDSSDEEEEDNMEMFFDNDSREASQHNNESVSVRQQEQFAFANVDLAKSDEGSDCDKMFLLSLLPYLKSIPDHYRLNVKMELMQVIQNAKVMEGDMEQPKPRM